MGNFLFVYQMCLYESWEVTRDLYSGGGFRLLNVSVIDLPEKPKQNKTKVLYGNSVINQLDKKRNIKDVNTTTFYS